MKNIYYIFLVLITAICCTSCNDEWTDEQFVQEVSFKAVPNSAGVTSAYMRYKDGGTVKYELPVLLSGSTASTKKHTVHVSIDTDTLDVLNRERFGERKELYYHLLDPQYYSFPETIEIPAGESMTPLPIDFTLGGKNEATPLDLTEKWILPVTILEDPSYDYQVNPRKHYRKALLNITPFNDYSGEYNSAQCRIYLEGESTPFPVAHKKTYVYDDETTFFYAGLRDEDYLDRRYYRVYMKFTDERIDLQKRKLELWSDNADPATGNAFQIGSQQAYYTVLEEMDAVKPYLKHVIYTVFVSYTFEDYTISPGNRLKYRVEGTMTMGRKLNTLIPDEDQQIEWE